LVSRAHAKRGSGSPILAPISATASAIPMTERHHPVLDDRLRHDLRTPLAIIMGFGELLAAERPLDDEIRRDYARRVVEAGEELRRLIDT
jgi:signal transduction histidine kinase